MTLSGVLLEYSIPEAPHKTLQVVFLDPHAHITALAYVERLNLEDGHTGLSVRECEVQVDPQDPALFIPRTGS